MPLHRPVMLHSGHQIPPRLLDTIAGWPADQVTADWLDSFPPAVAALCAKWDIQLDQDIPETFITLVLPGHSGILGPVVIKGSPLGEEFLAEATALRLASGTRVARVFDIDLSANVMIIERILPGTQLRDVTMSDEDATRLAARLAAGFWRPVTNPVGLHPLHRWMRALLDRPPDPGPIPDGMVREAQRTARSLLEKSSESCLLHGDFQHHNVLRRDTDEWVVIDPKGLVGPRGFDIAAWMYNPPGVMARADYGDLVDRRIAICSDAWQIDRTDLLEWAFVGSVLSCCWSANDSTPEGLLGYFLPGAEILHAKLH